MVVDHQQSGISQSDREAQHLHNNFEPSLQVTLHLQVVNVLPLGLFVVHFWQLLDGGEHVTLAWIYL